MALIGDFSEKAFIREILGTVATTAQREAFEGKGDVNRIVERKDRQQHDRQINEDQVGDGVAAKHPEADLRHGPRHPKRLFR